MSAKNSAGAIATYQISVNGTPIHDTYQVLSIEIEKAVNNIPVATIRIQDGDTATTNFAVSSSSTFVPGNELAIQLGYDNKNETAFKGIITQQRIRAGQGATSYLEVVCYDKALQMTLTNKNAGYTQMTDSDIIGKIISNYSLKSNVASTSAIHPQVLQYNTTDWDYLLALAKANGQVVLVNDGTITTQRPDADTDSVEELTYGDNIYELDIDMDAATQLNTVQFNAWDYRNQQVINAQSTTAGNMTPGNISSKKLAEAVGSPKQLLQTAATMQTDTLQTTTKATITYAELAKTRGSISAQGSTHMRAGHMVTLTGLGDRFDGGAYVSALKHTLSEGNWVTTIQIGLPADEHNTTTPADTIQNMQGLANAIVKQVYNDPDSEYRVLINIPLADENTDLWARLSGIYASNGVGSFFYPEAGDEVLVGFMNNNPRDPVILGSLYSSKHKSPIQPDEHNSQKGIVTRSGLRITFNDETKTTEIATPSNNKLILSDDNKSITIADQNANKITMSESGIEISSPKNITLNAQQQITLNGGMGTNITADGGDLKLNGMNIKADAQMQASINGNMTTEVKGGTELTLKGAMVMIN